MLLSVPLYEDILPLLFEINAEVLPVKLTACHRITDDWTKTRDEENSDISKLFHDTSLNRVQTLPVSKVLPHEIYLALHI